MSVAWSEGRSTVATGSSAEMTQAANAVARTMGHARELSFMTNLRCDALHVACARDLAEIVGENRWFVRELRRVLGGWCDARALDRSRSSTSRTADARDK